MATPAELAVLAKGAAQLGRALDSATEARDGELERAFRESFDAVVIDNATAIAEMRGLVGSLLPAFEAFKRLVDVVETAFDWSDVPIGDRPLVHDLVIAARRFSRDYEQAGNNAKRKLLMRSVVGEFNPKFLHDGWSRVFAEKTRRLEPPHVDFLRWLADEYKAKFKTRGSVNVKKTDERYVLLRDLEAEGFVSQHDNGGLGVEVHVSGSADRFFEFLWDYDAPSKDGS